MNGKQLKNSILQWAIQGKLVPQDSNDEPASVLLDKIRQEKERLIKEKKIKRDKNASIIYRGEDNSYYEKILATGEVKCIDEEIPFEIPQGWEWVRLNSYSDVRDGTHDTPQYVVSGYPLITSKDFIGGIFDFSKTKYIDERTFIEINKRSNVQIGDILFSMIGGNIGSMILITKENYFDMAIKNVALFKHYIYNDILIKYLYLYLQSQVVSIKNTASGGAQSFVSLNMLRNYLMPIPPLNEQNRIIEKFKSLDFVIQRYEKSYRKLNNLKQELFPKLRKSILQEAIQGKLVPQIAEEGTAQKLLEQIKTEKQKLVKEGKLKKSALTTSVIFRGDDNKYYEKVGADTVCIDDEIPFDIPVNWAWVRLDDICSFIHRGKSPKYSLIKKYPVVAQKCNQWSGFSIEKAKFIEPQSISSYKEEYILQDEDLMWNSTGLGTLGRMAIYYKKLNPYELAVADSHVTVIRPYKQYVVSEYLYYYFASNTVQSVIEDKSDGSTKQKELSTKTVKSYLVPLPPMEEQMRIVEKVEELTQLLK